MVMSSETSSSHNDQSFPTHVGASLSFYTPEQEQSIHFWCKNRINSVFENITMRVEKALQWDKQGTIAGLGCVEDLLRSAAVWKQTQMKTVFGKEPIPDRNSIKQIIKSNFSYRKTEQQQQHT